MTTPDATSTSAPAGKKARAPRRAQPPTPPAKKRAKAPTKAPTAPLPRVHVNYKSSVMTAQAGWRAVTITARAEQVTPGTARVLEVLAIDGEAPTGYTSRTGAKRQQYNAAGVAQREVGARKRLSACTIINDPAQEGDK
jgi:hypothetical protein